MAFRGSAAQTLCQSILVQHLLKNNIRWVFYVTWLSTTRNLGQRPDLYLCYIKKKEKKTPQHYLLKTRIQLRAPSWIMILCVRFWWQQGDYGLWRSSIQFNWVLCLQHTELKGSQLKQQHKYQHWKIMDLHFPNEKYSIISVKLTLCILSFHQHLYLFRVFISQPLHTRSQLGRRA